jgi:hypothetical protein
VNTGDPPLVDRILAERERRILNRVWAALMLASGEDMWIAIMLERPVPVRGLDRTALRRALQAEPPAPDSWITIHHLELDRVALGGPFA